MIAEATPVQAVAFDLDGTLIDTAPDIGAALNRALQGQGLPRVDFETAREWIGDGPDRLIERALEHLGVPAAPGLQGELRTAFDAATLAAPLEHGRVEQRRTQQRDPHGRRREERGDAVPGDQRQQVLGRGLGGDDVGRADIDRRAEEDVELRATRSRRRRSTHRPRN